MKILHVITSFPPAYAYGGPPQSSYHTAKAQVEHGHDVTVFTTDAKNATERVDGYENPECMDGIEVYRYRNVSNRLAWANFPVAPGMAVALRRHAGDFDVIHTHEYRTIHAWFTHRWASQRDVAHLLQPRGAMPRSSKSRQKQIFDNLFGIDIVEGIDGLIASSRTESDQYSDVIGDIGDKRIEHVPNGISADDYRDVPARGQFREKHDFAADTPLILYLGRIHERKGIDLLIEAVAAMREEGSPTELVVVGPDDGNKKQLEALTASLDVANSTHFIGPLYDEEKLAAYRDADVSVLPSKDEYESFGNVVVEAMACGTPTVVTEVCGVADWLDHESCLTVSPDPPAIRTGIEEILRDSLSEDSIRRYVRENFAWKAVAADLESVYSEVTT